MSSKENRIVDAKGETKQDHQFDGCSCGFVQHLSGVAGERGGGVSGGEGA